MELDKDLNCLPLLRPLGAPLSPANICLIALKDDLAGIGEFTEKFPNLKLRALVIPDLPLQAAKRLKIKIGEETLAIRGFEWLGECPELEKVFLYSSRQSYIAAILSQLCIHLAPMYVINLWLAGHRAPEQSLRKAMPGFFRENAERLPQAQNLFADQFSKRTFAGRIKAILTGNAGYIPIAAHREYFHPLVRLCAGNVMIDGGVSDLVESQIAFAETVGPEGRIYGFEPIPEMAASAQRQLAAYPFYQIQDSGLAREEGSAVFDNLRDSSRIAENDLPGKGQIVCSLTSIDAFCEKNGIGRVDFIKLDIEGGEQAALEGAELTIRKYRPNLAICLYHKPEDLWEIPFCIKHLVPEYELYLAHSSCQFTDTVLYARCP